ncbi:NFX1-type zinc finger-containing protein 1-like [Schistocerca nitens]|uniref:NFX1-type zinc finger-containing protein 1-like n=1 Tax=Schistocerca nitens TaxID=7011 RepID=UPI0021185112|nr:NFX1-type zinc finger-containing protein 1-like [Schistocerca nitens]
MGNNNTRPSSNSGHTAQYSVSSSTQVNNSRQFGSAIPHTAHYVDSNRTSGNTVYNAQSSVADTISNRRTGTGLNKPVARKTQSFEPDLNHPYQRLQLELAEEARVHHVHNQQEPMSSFNRDAATKAVSDIPVKSSQHLAKGPSDRFNETLSRPFPAAKFVGAQSSTQNSQVPKVQNVTGKSLTANFAPSAPTFSELHSEVPMARVIPTAVMANKHKEDYQKSIKENFNCSSQGQLVGENGQSTKISVNQPRSSGTGNILKQNEGIQSKDLVKEQSADVSKTVISDHEWQQRISSLIEQKCKEASQTQENCEIIDAESSKDNGGRSAHNCGRANDNRGTGHNHGHIDRKDGGRSRSGDHRGNNNRGKEGERGNHKMTERDARGCQNDLSSELTESSQSQNNMYSSTENLASNGSHNSRTVVGDTRQGQSGNYLNKGFYNENKVGNCDLMQKCAEPRYFIGYRRLLEFVDGDPEEAVVVLANKHSGFYELLKDNLKPDWLVLVVKLLANICKTNLSDKKVAVLSETCSLGFHEQLSFYLSSLSPKQNESDKLHLRTFIYNLIKLYATVVELIPNTGCELAMLATIDAAIKASAQYLGASYTDDIFNNLVDLKNQIKLSGDNERKGLQKEINLAEELSATNFRELCVLPTTSELTSNREPFLRGILMQGAYTNVEHYLDVHFRLLKEDLIRPLRENINRPWKGKTPRFRNLRLYRKVYFTRWTMVGGKIGHIVSFDPDNFMEKAKLTSCGMLRSDSLLCFSNNNFKDVLFATVMCNYDFMLKKGYVVVCCIDMEESRNDEMYSRPYVMIELKLNFKPYFHTLKALQKMQVNEFPMPQYIIDVVNQRMPPEYLSDAQNGRSKLLKIDGKDVVATDGESWPKASQLQLDESQYSAFRTALTEKFVLIQGPPGTGKKFLSLKIMKTFLENSQAWNSKKGPILVICLRDRTLDQLMEGFLKFTPNIIRIGGKTMNEQVTQLNLTEKQKLIKRRGPNYHVFCHLRNSLSAVVSSFKRLESDINAIDSNCGILSITSLESCMSEVHVNSFKNNINQVDNSLFLKWLEEGLSTTSANETETPAYIDSLEETVSVRSNNITYDITLSDETDDDIGLEVDLKKSIEFINFALDFKASQEAIDVLRETIRNIRKKSSEEGVFNSVQKYEEELRRLTVKLKYFQNSLLADQKLNEKLDPLHNLSDLWATDSVARWSLYRQWVSTLKCRLLEELQQLASDVISKSKKFEEFKAVEEYELLLNSDIVGITTAAAAQFQPLLKRLECKIAIVEEANEILESQIAVFLTSHCQHLIMIGDSLQLRPSTSVYELRQKYNLDLSLFERMLNNGVHCEILKTQHRMRSEFVRLLVPAIYPAIKTHASVKKYEEIAGVVGNLFFITHQQTEEEVPGLKSYRNPHEGDFLVALCRHLILQGHAPENITILTTYVAQVFYIQQKLKSTSLIKEVRIVCVDNFKGEENDIILLSLVRSNKDGNIDFWKVENRISGVLSRARKGFYIIGNMDCFTSVSDTWKKINNAFKSMAAIGPSLALHCKLHSEQLSYVSSASDFVSLLEEGCQLPCNDRLPCGHTCPLSCHLEDRNHSKVRCTKLCERSPAGCKFGHQCEKQCYEECGVCGICGNKVVKILPCGHTLEVEGNRDAAKQLCTVSVLIKLPCGHETVKPCHQKAEKIFCPHPCENRLRCGHQCLRKCHIKHDPDHLRYQCRKKCGRKNIGCRNDHMCQKLCYEDCSPCIVNVKQKLTCNHLVEIPCKQDPKEVKCQMNCTKKLPCGHPCKMRCGEPCGNCQVEVQKKIKKCGHFVMEKCSLAPNPNKCKSPCERQLPCGHRCTRMCGQSCTTTCNVRVQRTEPGACGHNLTVPCHMNKPEIVMLGEVSAFCSEPCNALLDCGHVCSGTCSECFQGRVHLRCTKDCEKILICGHKCPVPCSQSCPPCTKKCSHRCRHSKCANQCGEPCTPCREKCGWQCEHLRCTRQCHELCDRKPCYKPCKLKLKCGHNCIGFCGDPCPPLCRICNHSEVTTIFFGHEADRDARFVLLEDCNHVIESKALETWIKQSEDEITTKVCPRCKTPITKTQRYLNDVKVTLEDVCKVKAKVFGIQSEIESKRSLLLHQITQLMQHSPYVIGSAKLKQHLHKLKQQMLPVQGQHRNQLSIMDTESLELHIKFMQEIVMTMRYASGGLDSHSITKVEQQVLFLMNIMETRGRYLSNQEVNDINCELNRFSSFLHLCRLESTKMYKMHCNNAHVQYQYDIARKTVCSIKKFTTDQSTIFRQSLGNLNRILNNAIVLPTQERQQIVKALNLKQGHWYKCPNGHIYVITECGRAMQVSRCNECGEKVGGRRHTLLSSNQVATEMN